MPNTNFCRLESPRLGCRCQAQTLHGPRAACPHCPLPLPAPAASSGHLAKVKPLTGQQQFPVPVPVPPCHRSQARLSRLGIRTRSQSLHEELPQQGGRTRSQQWEEGQSHSESWGGKVHPLGWGGAGKESLSRGLAELWVWLESSEPSSVQPKPKAVSCRSQQGKLGWPGVQENNCTLCCLITRSRPA